MWDVRPTQASPFGREGQSRAQPNSRSVWLLAGCFQALQNTGVLIYEDIFNVIQIYPCMPVHCLGIHSCISMLLNVRWAISSFYTRIAAGDDTDCGACCADKSTVCNGMALAAYAQCGGESNCPSGVMCSDAQWQVPQTQISGLDMVAHTNVHLSSWWA